MNKKTTPLASPACSAARAQVEELDAPVLHARGEGVGLPPDVPAGQAALSLHLLALRRAVLDVPEAYRGRNNKSAIILDL